MSTSKNTDKGTNKINKEKKRYTLEELLNQESQTNWAALISEEKNMSEQQNQKLTE